jgi:predicted nicotinamide N-methyase
MYINMLLLILSLAVSQPSKFFAGGFSPRSTVSLPSLYIYNDTLQKRELGRFSLLLLHAKSKKRQGRGGRRGTTIGKDDDSQSNSTDQTLVVPKPAKTKRVQISLERLPPQPLLQAYAYEVDDVAWWDLASNTNPFGAKCWPSSLGVAQFLAQWGRLDGRLVLELGCGTAVPSIVAAQCGATVVASDISMVALSLASEGWLETSARHTAVKDEPRSGSLSTIKFDIFSSLPLPLESKNKQPPIVIAAAMMYQADLAEALARRLAEACAQNAWVILGDDDTGEREGGREKFLMEFARIQEGQGDKPINQVWTEVTVKHKSLGWVAKQVKLLHLNPPPGIVPANR